MYSDYGNSYAGTAVVGTVSGTSISFGSKSVFVSNTGSATLSIAAAFDTNINKVLIAYIDYTNSGYSTAVLATVSGTSISFGTPLVYSQSTVTYNTVVFDSVANKLVISYEKSGGTSSVYTDDGSNSTDFVGITDEIISSGASGSVIVQGGVATKASANLGNVLLAGAKSTFESAGANYCCAAYDVNSNRVVVVWAFGYPAYAAVGTVSGTSITFGTAVQFNNAYGSNFAIAYDSNVNKVAIVWTNSNQGTAIVGTVSGTSISFGAENAFEASSNGSLDNTIAFDSTANKFVIAYRNYGNSSYGTSVVATVTGTSIGFGTKVVFNSATTEDTEVAYDSNANTSVIVYKDSGNSAYGTAIVGTVSGTSISFGAEAVFQASTTTDPVIAFDSNVNKLIIAYADETAQNGKAIVGTVSGTGISFGTASIFYSTSIAVAWPAITFNPSKNNAVIGWRATASPYAGNMITATVSGTSVSFGTVAIFNAGGSRDINFTYDSTSEKVVIVYKDQGNSNYGTASVISESAATLTIGTDYFVQADGTLSTTSSTVPAGRALSTTSMLLEG